MSVAACLALYGFVVAVLAPWLLLKVGQSGAAPRFAVAAWLSAIGSTVLAWVGAFAILLIDLFTHQLSSVPQRFMDSCLMHLHDAAVGGYGWPIQWSLLLLSTAAAIAAVVTAMRLAHALVRARRSTHAHARLARMAGRHHPELDAVVLEVDEPAAYYVAGKPHTVVVSRGALTALDDDHLDAVLAHERAHLTGRHHLILALTRGLAGVAPRLRLFTTGATEVARLLEMIADDAAARIHGRPTVVAALVTFSDAANPDVDADSADRGDTTAAFGTTPSALASRLERLVAPPAVLHRTRARVTLAAALAAATLIPLASILSIAVGLAICEPLPGD
ncbi:M56 family metallopeptidase [Nocardia yamanashiensis]|uniref:M56 family metallopeptidase n=1 Tax=Nocardia yamanashiensis TaxID=209247 RepID=UPI0008325073|nr:M56 family metallopeptidase [Nocardia yamanashiensis]